MTAPPEKQESTSMDIQPLHTKMANAIRVLAVDAVQKASSGHPGMPAGFADVATVLFSKFLKFDPKNPDWPDRDRFILSAGHGSMLLYSLLHLTGYEDMTMDQLKNFRQMGSKTAGHPEYGEAAGIETTTGPLGQGIGNAVGMAMAERMLNARFGDDLVDHYTYVAAGDGCLMEGISHEALSMAGHLKLNKLIVLWDDNEICIDGDVAMTESGDQCKRMEALGFEVYKVDGHDQAAIADAIAAAKASDMPSFIACRTTIGFGAPTKAGTSATHGAPLGDEEISGMRQKLGWDSPPFEIPDDVLSAWREAGARSAADQQAWQTRLDASDQQDEFNRLMRGELPQGWQDKLHTFMDEMAKSPQNVATRKASGMTLDVLTAAIPELIGGSADLTGSVNTKAKNATPITPGDFSGSYIHYGVREHGMAAAMNGMALHKGIIPFAGTFLVFTDYCRPSIRLSALMKQQVIYVMTHDSIGLGEDGPTHQSVEQLSSLRAMPNLNVFRPADVVETAECWQAALEHTQTPSVLSLTRQGIPQVRLEKSSENKSAKGGYILRDAAEAAVTLIATGSEVHLAVAAQEQLKEEGISARVVSMPCTALFDQQDQAYRYSVIDPTTVSIAVEAAIGWGWERYADHFIGMTSFGASAPAGELYEHFGITTAAIVKAAKERTT